MAWSTHPDGGPVDRCAWREHLCPNGHVMLRPPMGYRPPTPMKMGGEAATSDADTECTVA